MVWIFVFGKSHNPEAPSRILVIRIDHIGDAINTVPLIRYLRKNYPKAKITVLCDTGAFLWQNCPYVDEVLLYKTNNPLLNRGRRKIRYIFRPFTYWPVLHKRKFDLVLDSVGRTETHIISYLCAGAKRISNTYYPYGLFGNKVACKHYDSQLHETKRSLSLAKPSNKISDDECSLEIWLTKEKIQLADSYLKQHGVSQGDKILGIHAGAASPLRLWPVERYSAAASQLMNEYNMKAIFFESPDNIEVTQQFISYLSKSGTEAAIIKAPDLISLTAFISRCTLFLCNDSGPMHLAAATKIPMVTIFGPGEYLRWQPLHCNSKLVRQYCICSPCSQDQCSQPHCILQVETSQVLVAAEEILSNVRKISDENSSG